MLRAEQRRTERYHLKSQPDGKLFVRAGAVRHPVAAVRDISSAGISVALAHDFSGAHDSGAADVTVEYLSPSGKVEVVGRIIWRTAENPAGGDARGNTAYVLGIELLGSTILAAALQPAEETAG